MAAVKAFDRPAFAVAFESLAATSRKQDAILIADKELARLYSPATRTNGDYYKACC